VPVLFGQHAVNGEEIAENPDAPLGCGAVPCDRGRVARPFTHGPENIQIDGRFQSCRALVRLQHVKNKTGSQRTLGMVPRVHKQPPSSFC
jgi:hypothetical protein